MFGPKPPRTPDDPAEYIKYRIRSLQGEIDSNPTDYGDNGWLREIISELTRVQQRIKRQRRTEAK